MLDYVFKYQINKDGFAIWKGKQRKAYHIQMSLTDQYAISSPRLTFCNYHSSSLYKHDEHKKFYITYKQVKKKEIAEKNTLCSLINNNIVIMESIKYFSEYIRKSSLI